MSHPFNPQAGPIVIRAELVGPTGSAILQLALDTGATSSLVSTALLLAVGYDPSAAPIRTQITTASGIEYVPLVTVSKLTALGKDAIDFPVLGHTLPPSAAVDGLIGLDFLRGMYLTIDFRAGLVELT